VHRLAADDGAGGDAMSEYGGGQAELEAAPFEARIEVTI